MEIYSNSLCFSLSLLFFLSILKFNIFSKYFIKFLYSEINSHLLIVTSSGLSLVIFLFDVSTAFDTVDQQLLLRESNQWDPTVPISFFSWLFLLWIPFYFHSRSLKLWLSYIESFTPLLPHFSPVTSMADLTTSQKYSTSPIFLWSSDVLEFLAILTNALCCFIKYNLRSQTPQNYQSLTSIFL